MKIYKAGLFSKDKKIIITGFRDKIWEIENRYLWSEIIIREINCKYCKSEDRITLHTKDIKKLIKALDILLKLQVKRRRS